MKKSDLKNGMVVEYKNEDLRLVLGEKLITLDTYNQLYHYNENLINIDFPTTDLDIMKVYSTQKADTIEEMLDRDYLILVWEREKKEYSKEYPKLTQYEFKSLKRMMTKGYSDIARDKDKNIVLSTNSLEKGDTVWYSMYGYINNYIVFNDDFKFVKWSDSEAWYIRDLLDNCEVEE